MSTKVEKRILVNVPVSTAYNQWTQFEEFPHFMGGVKSVRQLSDDQLEWVAEIAGVRRQWTARILEQVPDRKVSWAATEGAHNAGVVEFDDAGGGQTSIRLSLEYDPEGIVEKVGDKLHVVDRQAEADLKRFKEFIEDAGYASGAWRGSVHQGTASDMGAGTDVDAADAADASTPVQHVPSDSVTSTSAAPGTGRTPGHAFDQTNGLVDFEGESDETAEGEVRSAAERRDRQEPGSIPPLGGNLGQH